MSKVRGLSNLWDNEGEKCRVNAGVVAVISGRLVSSLVSCYTGNYPILRYC